MSKKQMCKNSKMLTAKAEETSLISSWHYFCASVSSLSVYLTGNDNIYPISELLILKHRAQGKGIGWRTQHIILCAQRLKNGIGLKIGKI